LRLLVLDAAGREAPIHDVAPPLVERLVEVDHRRDPAVPLGPRALAGAEDLGRLRDGHDVVVARDAPEAAVGARVPVDRSVFAHPAEALPGIEIEVAVEESDVVADGVVGHALHSNTGA